MSKSDRSAFGEAHGGLGESPVLDFLYCDARRIGSFLSQFDPSGHLTSRKQTDAAIENEAQKVAFKADANFAVAKGSATREDQVGSTLQDTEERQFDPFWSNAISFIDLLHTRGLVISEIEVATFGQFVSAVGQLSIVDLDLTYRILKREGVISAFMAGEDTPGQRAKNFALELLAEMPQTIEMTLNRPDADPIWGTMNGSLMTSSTGEIMLKHGIVLSGEWTVLGIMDARANDGGRVGRLPREELEMHGGQGLRGMTNVFAPMVRALLGRPENCHGMTPLLIYRSVQSLQ